MIKYDLKYMSKYRIIEENKYLYKSRNVINHIISASRNYRSEKYINILLAKNIGYNF